MFFKKISCILCMNHEQFIKIQILILNVLEYVHLTKLQPNTFRYIFNVSRTTSRTQSLTSGIRSPNSFYHQYHHHRPHSSSNWSLKVLLNPLRQSHRNIIFLNHHWQICSLYSLSSSRPRHIRLMTDEFRWLLQSTPMVKRQIFWHVN